MIVYFGGGCVVAGGVVAGAVGGGVPAVGVVAVGVGVAVGVLVGA